MSIIDALFEQLSTVQSGLSPVPNTIAAAATISPTGFVTFLTGTTAVATINPPVAGVHMIVLIFTNGAPGGLTGGTGVGQPKATVTAAQNVPVVCIYDPVTQLYWCGTIKLS